MQSYITKLGNFWARQRRSLVGGGGRQQVSHWWALHLLCIPSPRTVCLSVSSPQTQGNLRISSFFQLFPSFPVQVSRWVFCSSSFFLLLPMPPSSPLIFLTCRSFVGAATVAGSRGAERVNISQSCHTVQLGRLLMRGAWRSFLGVGGRGQTVSVSVSAYAVICSCQFPLSLKCSILFGGDVASQVPTHLRRSLLVGCGSVCLQVTDSGGQLRRRDGRVARGKLRRRRLV